MVLVLIAPFPTATLLPPVVFNIKAAPTAANLHEPIATLEQPVVFDDNA